MIRLLALLIVAVSAMSVASAVTQTRAWAGVARVTVVCRASAETPAASLRLQETLCAAVAAAAASGATVPVSVVSFGDPAMFDAGSLVLLVNAASRPDAGTRLVTFSIRPWRVIAAEDNDLFGAPPQAARVSGNDAGPELETAIKAALDGVLPWRQP